MSIIHRILKFIPDEYRHNEETFRKARLFVQVCFITSFFSTFYLITSTVFGMRHPQLAMIFNAVSFIILPFLFRYNKISLKIAANLYIFIGCVGVVISAWFTSGLNSTVIPWLAVLPITALMLTDKKTGWIWTAISYGLIAIIAVFKFKEFDFPEETPNVFKSIFDGTNLTGLVLLIYLIATVFENTKNTALFNLEQRNQQLDNEKKRSEELLLNILPADVAEELKQTGRSKARFYQNVTVLFTDFLNFTRVSETMDPEALVSEIDYCFSNLDRITEKYGLEKIKTIGDAYLAVSGLPVEHPDHAERTIDAAIEIQKFMMEYEHQRRHDKKMHFSMRIGINSGEVVAGIVGIKKFAYDIWGDTVNTAARMEQHGESNKINVSQATYDLVKGKYLFTHRGQIQAKNKGAIDMYFVDGPVEN